MFMEISQLQNILIQEKILMQKPNHKSF